MTYQSISWNGGTKPRRTDQDRDDREQSEEPPAEYWTISVIDEIEAVVEAAVEETDPDTDHARGRAEAARSILVELPDDPDDLTDELIDEWRDVVEEFREIDGDYSQGVGDLTSEVIDELIEEEGSIC